MTSEKLIALVGRTLAAEKEAFAVHAAVEALDDADRTVFDALYGAQAPAEEAEPKAKKTRKKRAKKVAEEVAPTPKAEKPAPQPATTAEWNAAHPRTKRGPGRPKQVKPALTKEQAAARARLAEQAELSATRMAKQVRKVPVPDYPEIDGEEVPGDEPLDVGELEL